MRSPFSNAGANEITPAAANLEFAAYQSSAPASRTKPAPAAVLPVLAALAIISAEKPIAKPSQRFIPPAARRYNSALLPP
jgi:hypothetical protein